MKNVYQARLVEPIRPLDRVYVIPKGTLAYRQSWWLASVVSVTPNGDLKVRTIQSDGQLGETVHTVDQFAR